MLIKLWHFLFQSHEYYLDSMFYLDFVDGGSSRKRVYKCKKCNRKKVVEE